MDFADRLFIEYPVPKARTIWWGDGVETQPIEDINVLIETSVKELGSDILITAFTEATGIATQLPDTSVSVVSAQLSSMFLFQGNRLLKHTFDSVKHVVYLRYYPATIKYKRRFQVSDLDQITGDELIYVKAYMLWKMAEKELSYLKSVTMTVDHGAIDLTVLESFRDKMEKRYTELKPEILIYNSAF